MRASLHIPLRSAICRIALALAFLVVACEPDIPENEDDNQGIDPPEIIIDEKENVSSSEKGIIYLTPDGDLNPPTAEINSHKGFIDRSILSPIYGTYVTLGKKETFWDIPIYPRLVRCNDGNWLMSYHYGDAGAQAGNQVLLLRSPDLIHWEPGIGNGSSPPFLFPGGRDRPLFAGAFLHKLRDGKLMAVSAYRKDDTSGGNYHYTQDENGLAIRFSTNDGKTWTTERYINVGTNWEPFVLELPDGRIQIYFTDCNHVVTGLWTGPAAYGGSGVAMIQSDDGGQTWSPAGQEHHHVIRQRVAVKNGESLYTDQMAAVVLLNDGITLAAALESDMGAATGRSDYKISLAYSDPAGSWGGLDENGEGPRLRENAVFKGCAPYMVCFPSGETVLAYNTDYFCYRIGDENAKNFGEEQQVFKADSDSRGYWGTLLRVDDHRLFACVGGSGNVLQMGQFYLNHAIRSTSSAITVDGGNNDWLSGGGSFVLCSKGPSSASLRCAQDADHIYFIVEVRDANLSSNDYFQIFLSPAQARTLSEKTIRIRGGASGLFSTDLFKDGWRKTSCSVRFHSRYDGTLNDSSDSDKGYLAEISIPKAELDLSSGYLLANFSLKDADNSTSLEDALSSVAVNNTDGWIPVYGIL